jgi:hypothetical protein
MLRLFLYCPVRNFDFVTLFCMCELYFGIVKTLPLSFQIVFQLLFNLGDFNYGLIVCFEQSFLWNRLVILPFHERIYLLEMT